MQSNTENDTVNKVVGSDYEVYYHHGDKRKHLG